jgi:hypothetical protein
MQANLVARADRVLGRHRLMMGLRSLEPDHVRVQVRRDRIVVLEVIQAGDRLSIWLPQIRETYTGPAEDFPSELAQAFPIADLTILADVPLIDLRLAEHMANLERTDPPRFGRWRRHVWLEGDPARAIDSNWSGFTVEEWALDPETLTVEGVALRLPTAEGERVAWLSLTFSEYAEFDLGEGDTAVLPREFRLSHARHPWRRHFRGEEWSVEGTIVAQALGRAMTPSVFAPRLPPGTRVLPLAHFRGIPMAAMGED